jgi:hypothetical protein
LIFILLTKISKRSFDGSTQGLGDLMQFVIADSEGAVLDTFEDRNAAESALRLMVNHDWASSDELLLLPYDAAGNPAEDAIMFEDISARVFATEDGIDARVEVYPLGTATCGYFLQQLGGYFAQPIPNAVPHAAGHSTGGQLPLPA